MTIGPLALCLAMVPNPDAEVLTLEDAIEIAHAQTNDMIQARADVLLVDVEKARSLSAILPSVTLTLPVGYNLSNDVIIETRPYDAAAIRDIPVGPDLNDDGLGDGAFFGEPYFRPSLGLRQLVFDGGRWWVTLQRAGDIETLRKASLTSVSNNVRLNVVRQFYNLERARQSVETFRQQLVVSEDQLERARQRDNMSDVATAERNLASDRVNFARRRFAEDEARRNFNLALGRPADRPVKLVVPEQVATATVGLKPIVIPPVDDLVAEALAARPEIIVSKASMAVVEKNVAIRRADYYPRLSVGATYRRGWNGAGTRRPERAFGDPTKDAYVTFDATMSWSLFDGLRTWADVDDGEIQLKKAAANYENLQRNVAREVQSRVQSLELQVQVYGLARDGARSAGEAVRLARDLFNQGEGTALELRDAEQNYTQARLSAINARIDVEVAREELRKAVGRDIE